MCMVSTIRCVTRAQNSCASLQGTFSRDVGVAWHNTSSVQISEKSRTRHNPECVAWGSYVHCASSKTLTGVTKFRMCPTEYSLMCGMCTAWDKSRPMCGYGRNKAASHTYIALGAHEMLRSRSWKRLNQYMLLSDFARVCNARVVISFESFYASAELCHCVHCTPSPFPRPRQPLSCQVKADFW